MQFQVLSLGQWSILNFYILYEVKVKYLQIDIQVFQCHYIKRISLFWTVPILLSKIGWPCVWFWILYVVPLTCLSTFMQTPHFLDFSSFIITLEIPLVFQLCFFLKSCFCHFEVYIKHRISLSISTKNLAQILIWYLFS